jgi:hypothetical protein
MGIHNAAIDRIMLFQNYGGGEKPISQWVDDLEMWDRFPCEDPPCVRSSPSGSR